MRYLSLGTVSFTNAQNKTVAIRPKRPYPKKEALIYIKIKGTEDLDEIATRGEVYDEGGEMEVFKIFDQNRTAIVEGDFSLKKIRRLAIPE